MAAQSFFKRFALLPVLLLVVLFATSWVSNPHPLQAQTVVGRVMDAARGQPVEGAFVALFAPSGSRGAATLTRADGSFRMRASGPGEHRLEVERIGYATTTRTITVGAIEPVFVDVEIASEAVGLEGIQVEGRSRCDVRPEEGEATARIWEEVRKALTVTSWAQDESVLQFDVVNYDRTLDPERLRVRDEERRSRSGYHGGSPFVSVPAADLQAHGYVRDEGAAGYRYLAPDATVLLSDEFLDTHCFAVRTDDPPESSWIGLAFEPVQPTDLSDVEGVLWVERQTGELQRLDYRYTRLPYDLQAEQVGGRVDFERIPEGPWIVRRWHIRMPAIGLRRIVRGPEATPIHRPELTGLLERGGEIVEVRAPDGSPLLRGNAAVLAGIAWDSILGRPARGATVRLEGTPLSTTTAADGSFRFSDVPSGTYGAVLEVPRLEGIGWKGEPVEVTVRADEAMSPLELAVPSMERVLGGPCQMRLDPAADATLVGRARVESDGAGAPAGVTVAVDVEGVGTMRVDADEAGEFRVCGVPAGRRVAVWAEFLGQPGDTVALSLDRGEVAQRDVVLGSSVVAMDGLSVEVASAARERRLARGSSASFDVTVEEIQEARDEGVTRMTEIIRRFAPPSVSVSTIMRGPNEIGSCLQSTRTPSTSSGGLPAVERKCEMVAVYVDGQEMAPSEVPRFLEVLPLEDVEGIEFLAGSEATFRFGTGHAAGALVITTRLGGG